MLRPRITPCLLLHKGGLVKTVGFAHPKYVGDPINAIRIFNEKETDELIVLDIDATPQNQEPNLRLISQFAAECRMPLCYGGGVKTVEQATRIVALGVEKVALSSAAVDNPQLISEIAKSVGSQSVVVVLDARRRESGGYEVWTRNATSNTGKSPVEMAKRAEELGAGEIVVNSVDNDGTMKGYDLELAARIREAVRLPMTVLGGAGSLADMEALIATCGIVGASAGSMFVFKGPRRAVLINYPDETRKRALVASALARNEPRPESLVRA